MSNKINQLLENAKHESPLLTENDVISVINNRSLLGKKQTFFTLKNILIMSVLSSIIVGLWMVFYPTASTNLAEQTLIKSPKKKEQITEKSEANNLFVNADNNKTKTTAKETAKSVQLVDSLKNFPAINNKPAAKLFEPIPFTPIFNENPIDDNRNYFDKDGYLILTNEELAKLGIITDGNVLEYENVTDSIEVFYKTPEKKYIFNYYYLNISKFGGTRINNFKTEGFQNPHKKTCSFYPTAIIIIDKKDSSFNLLEPLGNFGFEKEFFNQVKENLIPVAVSLTSQPNKYSDNNTLIFWFKPEKSFLDSLPFVVSSKLTYKAQLFNKENYAAKVLNYRKKITNGEIQNGFDSLTVAKLKTNYITLNKGQLSKIGIKLTKKGFHFKSYQNIDNKTQKLDLRVKKYYTLIGNNDNPFQIKRKSTPFKAVAKTDISIKQIDYLMQFSDSISYSNRKEISEKYFRDNIQKLIPIKVDNNHVIWFEPTEELKRIIRIEKEIEIRKIDLSNVTFLNLNEKELRNLGIKLLQNGVEVPTTSYGEQGVFELYKKKETISTIISDSILSSKFKRIAINTKLKPKYSVPYLVTDEFGLNWRTYRFDTEKDDSNDVRFHQSVIKRIANFIPIKITSGNVSIIAWYEPDSLFLSLLPNKESTEIKTEYHAITNNLPAPSCKYFEVCQNVTGKINSYLAYPNPAEQTLNIEIDLAEERQLEFIVTDITGKIIKTLNQNLKQTKGIQTYTYQIGELTEGMYLLIITTDKGEKVSTRIVKK